MEKEPPVATGAHGWSFLRVGTNHVKAQLNGSYPLPEDFAGQWRALFEYRRERLAKAGARYSWLVVPNKECVYASWLPDDMRVVADRPVATVLAQAAGRIDAFYPLEALIERSRAVDTFAPHDSHWNHHGFRVAYDLLMARWGLPGVPDSELVIREGEMNDLGAKIGIPPAPVPFWGKLKHPRHTVVVDNRIKPLGHLFISEVDDSRLPTAVIFRDSFLTIGLPILAQSFRRLVVAWQPNIDYSIVEREKPDFVLGQQAERFVVQCPDDAHGWTNEEYVRAKRTLTGS